MTGLSLAQPLWLLLMLPLALGLVALARRTRRPLPALRARLSLALRLGTLLLVVLALAALHTWRREDRLAVVFAVDGSRSVGREGRDEARRFLAEASAALPRGDLAGVVAFGSGAMVETFPRERWAAGEVLARPGDDASDLGGAVRLARGLFPPGSGERLVLVTDGVETRGSLAESLAEAPPELDVVWVPLSRSKAPEVLVESVRAPDRVASGEPFQVSVTLRASRETEATLRLLRDGSAVSSGRVTLAPGVPNVFQVEQRSGQAAGAVSYEARVAAREDESPENNRASAIVRVEGRPRVLIVDTHPETAAPLASALGRAGLQVETGGPGALPGDLAGLLPYDGVLLSDVAATHFSEPQLDALRDYVELLGGGLTMLGGPESFGPGGYYRTPVEAVLPVDMEVKDKSSFPSLGLVLLIDKSGSMAGYGEVAKIEVAKTAAAEVVSLLTSIDRIGIVAFDDAAKWVVPLGPGDAKDDILSLLGTLRAGGGTDAYPAMTDARKALSGVKTRVKHVILLTDGQLAPRDHEGLARQMAADGLTLSTVGVGTDADLFTLEKVAEAGKGRFYRAEDVSLLPRIFLREAFRVARTWLVEEPFRPVASGDHALLSGGGPFPSLRGYVAASEKPGAERLLATHRGDPLLCVWRKGLGKSAAFTSDAKARWGRDWLSWEGYEPFWARLVRWTLRSDAGGRLRVAAEPAGGKLLVSADLLDGSGAFVNGAELRAVVVSPEGRQTFVPLSQTAPGRYEGEVPATTPGACLVAVVRNGRDGPLEGVTVSAVVPYSDEFRGLSREPVVLERLVAAGRVRVVRSADRLFEHNAPGAPVRTPLAPLLLCVAAVLAVAEVAVRRLRLPEWRWRAAAAPSGAASSGPARDCDVSRPSAGPPASPSRGAAAENGAQSPAPAGYTTRLLDAKRRSRR